MPAYTFGQPPASYGDPLEPQSWPPWGWNLPPTTPDSPFPTTQPTSQPWRPGQYPVGGLDTPEFDRAREYIRLKRMIRQGSEIIDPLIEQLSRGRRPGETRSIPLNPRADPTVPTPRVSPNQPGSISGGTTHHFDPPAYPQWGPGDPMYDWLAGTNGQPPPWIFTETARRAWDKRGRPAGALVNGNSGRIKYNDGSLPDAMNREWFWNVLNRNR